MRFAIVDSGLHTQNFDCGAARVADEARLMLVFCSDPGYYLLRRCLGISGGKILGRTLRAIAWRIPVALVFVWIWIPLLSYYYVPSFQITDEYSRNLENFRMSPL